MKTLIHASIFVLACLGGSISCSKPAKDAEKLEDEPHEVVPAPRVAKFDQIIIPRVDMADVTVEEALDFARLSSFKHDPDRDSEFRGFSVVVRQARNVQKGDAVSNQIIGIDNVAPETFITYAAENVRLLDLLGEIARQAGLDSYLTSDGVVLLPEGSKPFPNPKSNEGDVLKVIRKTNKTNKAEEPTPNPPFD